MPPDKTRKLAEPAQGYMMDSLDEVAGFKTTGHVHGHSQKLNSNQRRKLGQHVKMARELPKKSGYLLKKGPLKVRCVLWGRALRGAKGGGDAGNDWHCAA
jgi:hypothetical protein